MSRSLPLSALPPLSTRQVADFLTSPAHSVTYRMVDHLVRCDRVDLGEGAAHGSGSRRRWPLDVVARLELGTRIAEVSGRPWPDTCAAVLESTTPPPMRGWVFVDGGGSVAYADDLDGLTDVMRAEPGGTLCVYELTEPEAVYGSLRSVDLDAIPA